MRRISISVGHFPRNHLKVGRVVWLSLGQLSPICTAAVLCSFGCSSSSPSLLAQTTPAQDPAGITRSQKPENTPPKTAPKGPLLDLVSYQVPMPSDCQVAAKIRATVNGAPILDDEVREAIYPFLLKIQQRPEAERNKLRMEEYNKQLQQLIEREIIVQDVKERLKDKPQILEKLEDAARKEFDKAVRRYKENSGAKSDEEFKLILRQSGMSLEGMQRQVTRQFMATEYIKNLVFPAIERIGHEQIAEYYQLHPEEFRIPDGVTWQDIFIDSSKFPNRDASRQFAEQLVAKARAGEDFHAMVKQYDQGDSSYRNGEGYGHHRGEIKPTEAETILFNLHDGEVGPVVELKYGFHVLRLVKREYAGLKPLDEKTQTGIRNKLQGEAFEREYKRVIAVLKRNAAVEISTTP